MRAEGSPSAITWATVRALRGGGLSDDQVDELGDLVTEELAVQGFDADYKPTPYGVELENLIDVLNDA